MSSDGATGFLALIAALGVGLGVVWQFWLSEIIELTKERPRPTSTPAALEQLRRDLEPFRTPALVYQFVTGAAVVIAIGGAGVVVRDLMTGEPLTMSRALLLVSAGMTAIAGFALVSRCGRVATYLEILEDWS